MKIYAIINIINILIFNGAPAAPLDISVSVDPEAVVESVMSDNVNDSEIPPADADIESDTTDEDEVVSEEIIEEEQMTEPEETQSGAESSEENLNNSDSSNENIEVVVAPASESNENLDLDIQIENSDTTEASSEEVVENSEEGQASTESESSTEEINSEETVQENNSESTNTNEVQDNTVVQTTNNENVVVEQARLPLVGDLLINEVVSDPSAGLEWVEIKNATSDTINVAGLTLRDGGTRRVSLEGEMASNSYQILFFSSATLNNSGDAVRLFTADETLLDEVIYGDWESALPKAITPVKGQSLMREPNGLNSGNNSNDFKITTTLTPGASNILTLPVSAQTTTNSSDTTSSITTTTENQTTSGTVQTSTNQISTSENNSTATENVVVSEETVPASSYLPGVIVLSEMYPAPLTGETEWIEIYNTGSTTIDLQGWSVADAAGTKTNLSGTVAALEFFVVQSPRGKLNNDGDTVNLFDPSGQLISTMNYGTGLHNGDTLAWNGTGWTVTGYPTPGLTNKFDDLAADESSSVLQIATTDPNIDEVALDLNLENLNTEPQNSTDVQSVSLEDVRNLEKGTIVQVSGAVSIAPGVVSARTFYIGSHGLQVYLYGIDVPEISAGDVLELTGKISSTGYETRIIVSKPENIQVIGHEELLQPEGMEIGEISDLVEGWLVSINGTVTDKVAGRLIVDDGSGSISVVIKEGMNIDERLISPGDSVNVAGVISETQSGFRLLPRGVEDLAKVVQTSSVLGQARSGFSFSPIAILAGLFLSIMGTILVRRQVIEHKKHKELALVIE